MSVGEQDVHAGFEQRPAIRQVRLVQQRAADVLSPGGQERVRHAAADDERVHLGGQHLEHLELVRHLGAPDDGHERPGRPLQDPAQDLDLPGEAQARRAREEPGRPHDRGVGPVGGAEGLVHVGVEAGDEALHEGGVVGLLARIEAQVLGQLDPGAQRPQPLAHRVHLPAGVRGAGRPAEMRAGHHLGPLVLEPAQRRQRGRDPEVVGHRGPAPHADVEGDVEVDPHQHPLPVERGEIPQERDAAEGVHEGQPPTSTARSTRRLE